MATRGSIAFGASRLCSMRSLDDVLGLGEGGVGRGLVAEHQPERPVALLVVVPDLRRALFGGVFEIHHRRQLLVVDLDQIGGIARLRLGLRDHEGDAIADIADAVVADQRQPGAEALAGAPTSSGIGWAVSSPSLSALASAPVRTSSTPGAALAFEMSMLLIRAWAYGDGHGDRIGLVRQVDIVDVSPLAGQKTLVLDPLDRLPDAEFGHSHSLRKTFRFCLDDTVNTTSGTIAESVGRAWRNASSRPPARRRNSAFARAPNT